MTWKERYRRFRAWQQRPFHYELKSDELQHCKCCGHDFTGNYCPYCSQKAGTQRLTWKSSVQAMMGIWDLENRSFFTTLLQLLFRPGHLIADYWDGRRQSSFPPVKMLFVLGIIMSLLTWFDPIDNSALNFGELGEKAGFIDDVIDWMSTNQGWAMLIVSVLTMIPTWLLFRYAPSHPKHTMPEGFFMQVFINCITLVLSILLEIITLIFNNSIIDTVLGVSIVFIMPTYLFFIYKHLFGYGLWNILWRFLLTIVTAIVNFIALMLVIIAVFMLSEKDSTKYTIGTLIIAFLVFAFSAMLIAGGYVVGYSKNRDRQLKNTNNSKT